MTLTRPAGSSAASREQPWGQLRGSTWAFRSYICIAPPPSKQRSENLGLPELGDGGGDRLRVVVGGLGPAPQDQVALPPPHPPTRYTPSHHGPRRLWRAGSQCTSQTSRPAPTLCVNSVSVGAPAPLSACSSDTVPARPPPPGPGAGLGLHRRRCMTARPRGAAAVRIPVCLQPAGSRPGRRAARDRSRL